MMDQHTPLRLLLVEDDAISRSFMEAALRALPARVDAVASAAEAMARNMPYALWLIDARLPDASGIELLRRLRMHHPHTGAIAHTADTSLERRDELLAAGFADVLVKPLGAADLQARVRQQLPLDAMAIWNEDAALRALNGNAEHVAKLRELFINELPGAMAAIEQAFTRGDSSAMGEQLHKLRASCGFVGAERLGQAVKALQQNPSRASLEMFRQSAAALKASIPSA